MDSKVAFDRRPAEAAVQKPEAMEAYGGAATGVIRSDATTTSTVEPMPLRNVSTELLSVNEMSCSDRYEPVSSGNCSFTVYIRKWFKPFEPFYSGVIMNLF